MNIASLQQAAYQPIDRSPALGLGKKLDQARQDFEALSTSLQSGNLPGAQNSFNDLKKLLVSAGSIGAANSVKNDFDTLGKAIGSGDLPAAKKDLSQLQNDVQSIVKGYLHPSGLPVRLPAGNVYQAGLIPAKRISR